MRLLPALLVLATVPAISAVPAGSIITPPPPLQPQPIRLLTQPSDPRRPWTRFRDWIIGSVWGTGRGAQKYAGPPLNVRDRYESDVVLRFHLRRQEEAEALAAAAQALVLDIWTITVDHVDIRLSDDMVCDSSLGRHLDLCTLANNGSR